MSTDIIETRSDVLPDEEDVARELDRLTTQGDTTTLNEVAKQAAAYQEYEKRAKAAERADYFGRIKVMAEARIGSIDMDLHPRYGADPLMFDGTVVAHTHRSRWRALGMAFRMGALDRAMRSVEQRGDTVSTYSVYAELSETGIFWVATQPLLERYRELYVEQSITIKEVARRAGLKEDAANHILTRPGTAPARTRCRRDTAIAIARALDFDERLLQPAYFDQTRNTKSRRLRKARKLQGGRLDETYVLIRKALQELDRVAGSGARWDTQEAYVHLYEAEGIVGRALRRAV